MYISGRPRTQCVAEDYLELQIVLHPAAKGCHNAQFFFFSLSLLLFSFLFFSFRTLSPKLTSNLSPSSVYLQMLKFQAWATIPCCIVLFLLVMPVVAQDAMVSVTIFSLSSSEITGLYHHVHLSPASETYHNPDSGVSWLLVKVSTIWKFAIV